LHLVSALPLFGFVANPMILGWLAAASAPIVIHLLNKRKYRETSWAAMQFLLAAVKKNSRRMQLEQWLLLALRTLLILLAVIAAAEPGFRGAEQLVASGERVHRVVVVDGSFSMNYRPTGQQSYFEQAQALAERIVDNAREGDGLSLVVLGTPSRTVVGPPLFRKDEMRAIVEDLRQPHGAGNLPQCLNELDRLLSKSREMHPQIRRRIVYFVTDLGKQTWEPTDAARGTDALAEFQARCERWGGETAVSLIDVGASDAENAAVVSFDAAEPYAVVGLPTTLRAVVRNFGRQAKSRVPITLNVDGRKVEEKTIDLEPAGEATVEFDYPATNVPRAPGTTIYDVELGPDRLEVDNRRYLALETKPNLRVLVLREAIASEEEEYGFENLTAALKLRPGADLGGPSPVSVDVETDDVLQRRELKDYDCVFVVGVKRFTPSQAKILWSYVNEGGGLVTWLGPRVDAADYNKLLADGTERILPARLGPIVEEPQYKLNPLKYEHPLVAEFRGSEQGNLLNTPVYRYFRLNTADRPQTRRVLEFLNEAKDPFIVSENIGAGRSLLVATSLQASWTTMPLSPGFVPIVQELVSYAAGGRTAGTSRIVGQPLDGAFRRTTAAAQVTVAIPADDVEPELRRTLTQPAPSGTAAPPIAKLNPAPASAEVVPAGEFFRWSFAETPTSGIYAVTIAAAEQTTRPFAVNVDPRESELVKLASNRLTSLPWSTVPLHYSTDLQDFAEPARTFVASGEANPIHRWFLLGALVAAVGETLLAGRAGRGRR
jgi:hypothetical protein